jgi:hypothetical protein
MMETRQVVVCAFYDAESARDAMNDLREAGFSGEDISLLSPDATEQSKTRDDKGERAREGALGGLVVGGLFGGLAGWLMGLGALAVPGIGPFIGAGVLAATLGGAAVGAGVGAIAGALIRMGLPEHEARYYEGEARKGRTLVAVSGDRNKDEADRIMHNHGGYDREHPEQSRTSIPVR